MDIYVKCDFTKVDDNLYLRKVSLADSYYLNKKTALYESLAYVNYHKGCFKDVNFFEKPIETETCVVLGSYIWNDELYYFGVYTEYLIEI